MFGKRFGNSISEKDNNVDENIVQKTKKKTYSEINNKTQYKYI